MRNPSCFLSVCLLLFVTQILHARIILVPADSTTIQSGINGAVDGDTVMIADGTYTGEGNRDIELLGKSITVCSESGNAEACIIDVQGSFNEVAEHGFYIHNGEGPETVIRDLTIMNAVADGP